MSSKEIEYTFGKVQPQLDKPKQRLPSGSYAMSSQKRGYAVVLNFKEFDGGEVRKGSDMDAKNMCTLLKYLGYEVDRRDNQTYSQTMGIMGMYGREDHSQYDSFVCCVFSHGSKGGEVKTKDNKEINIQDIQNLFNGAACPTLHEKPKIFFIQACRGQGHQTLVRVPADEFMMKDVIPTTADFVFCYATPEGYKAWRKPGGKGSSFIEEVCRAFTEHAKYACFFDMMQLATRRVAERTNEDGQGVENPEVTSSLRKNIFFF